MHTWIATFKEENTDDDSKLKSYEEINPIEETEDPDVGDTVGRQTRM